MPFRLGLFDRFVDLPVGFYFFEQTPHHRDGLPVLLHFADVSLVVIPDLGRRPLLRHLPRAGKYHLRELGADFRLLEDHGADQRKNLGAIRDRETNLVDDFLLSQLLERFEQDRRRGAGTLERLELEARHDDEIEQKSEHPEISGNNLAQPLEV